MVWIPHISLFLSFRSVLIALQIPGKCISPSFWLFRWSLWLAIVEKIFRRVGAFTSRSWMKLLHLNSASWLTSIFRNGDGGSTLLLHSVEHSLLRISSIFNSTKCQSSSWLKMSRTIVGRWPPASARPSLTKDVLTSVLYGVSRLGVLTVTWKVSILLIIWCELSWQIIQLTNLHRLRWFFLCDICLCWCTLP